MCSHWNPFNRERNAGAVFLVGEWKEFNRDEMGGKKQKRWRNVKERKINWMKKLTKRKCKEEDNVDSKQRQK